MANPSRKIYFCNLITDLLHNILTDASQTTILIVCSTRDHFLKQLYTATHSPTDETAPSEPSCLLTKAIGLLSKSSQVKLIFCPTLEHLRAYIAVLRAPGTSASDELNSNRPLLAVVDLLALHVPTSEFSAQGLSRTFAAAVEVTARQGMDLVLCECRNALDPSSTECGERLWYEHVPILNGSVRMGGDDGIWRARGVVVKRVAERWFEFEETGPTTTAVDTRYWTDAEDIQ